MEFQGNQDFLAVLEHIEGSDVSVRNIIGKYHYQNYRSVFQIHKKRLAQDRNALLENCCALNAPIVVEINHSQTSGLDEEISGYEKTIQEKETCIEQNIDVLQSKRRIEILKHKIEELQKIKERLTTVQTSNTENSKRDKKGVELLDYVTAMGFFRQIGENIRIEVSQCFARRCLSEGTCISFIIKPAGKSFDFE